MNRKGFTLVELLGVIAILGILAVLIIPSVENIINKNKEKGLENQKNSIKLAAKNWLTDNKKLIDGDEVIVTIEDLKQQGYLELNIINPITNKCISNQNEVLIKLDGKKYSYKFNGSLRDGDDEDCGNINSKPHIYLFGKNSIILKQGEEFLEPGFSATTVDGEDISRNVEIIGEVDSSTIGEYEITYSVTDNGITSIKKRKVKVADDEKPYIHHPGTTLLLNSISTFDVLEDVYAVDNSGETIEVKAFTNLTLGITGEYKIIYYAKDSSGNEHEVTRKLIIKNNDNTIYNAIKNNANVYNADFDIQDLINGTSNVYSGVHDITLKEFVKDYYRNRKIFGNNNANNWVRIKDSVYRIIEFSNDFISLVYKKTCSGDICEGNGLITDQQFKVYGKDEVVISPDSSKNEIRKIQKKWVESQKIDKYLVSARTMVNHPTLMGYLNIYRHYDQYTSGEKTAEQLRSEGIQNFSEDLIKEYKYNILSSYNVNCLIHLYTQYGINSIYFISNENDTNTYITDFNPEGLDELQELNYTEEMYYTAFQIGNRVYGGITRVNETNTNTFQTVINVNPYLKISKGSGTESDPYVLVP